MRNFMVVLRTIPEYEEAVDVSSRSPSRFLSRSAGERSLKPGETAKRLPVLVLKAVSAFPIVGVYENDKIRTQCSTFSLEIE